jgi:hypothetical protein
MASVVAEICYSAVYLPSSGLALQALLMGVSFPSASTGSADATIPGPEPLRQRTPMNKRALLL